MYALHPPTTNFICVSPTSAIILDASVLGVRAVQGRAGVQRPRDRHAETTRRWIPGRHLLGRLNISIRLGSLKAINRGETAADAELAHG